MEHWTAPRMDNTGSAAGQELVWLLGQPRLQDYLSFVRSKVIGGEAINPRLLADEWREANDHYAELEESEAGDADRIECRELDPAVMPLAEALAADPHFRRTFAAIPGELCLVEIDRLIVSQNHVEQQFTDQLRLKLGDDPTPEDIVRFCQPLERRDPPVRIERISSDRFIFTCESSDFRSHPPVLFRPDQLPEFTSVGPVAAMLGLPVGFGSNFMTAVRSETRIVLQNGYHRAYALRALGITHAPVIVQTVTRRDELQVAASEDVCEKPEFYFRAARPPLFRDFFDPRFRKLLAVRPSRTTVEVELKVRQHSFTELG